MQVIQYNDYGPADVLHKQTRPDPLVASNEILVEIDAIGLTPFDCKLRAGALRKYFTPTFPFIPGRDGVGRVIQKGHDVINFEVGDAVAIRTTPDGPGSYAQRIAIPQDQAVRIPDGISAVDAAAVLNSGLSASAMIAMAKLKEGDHVLIHAAAGAVGGLLVQLCRHKGVYISGTCHSTNREYVLNLGADRAIAYDTEDFSKILKDQDVVFDLMGGSVHDRSYSVLKSGGRLVRLVADPFVDRSTEFAVTLERAIVTNNLDAIKSIFDMVAVGKIKPQISRILPFTDVVEAHRLMDAGDISRGRVILVSDAILLIST